MTATSNGATMTVRKETDSLCEVEHFSIGHDLVLREMTPAYAVLEKAAADANHAGGRLDDELHRLSFQVCDEILAGQHADMFPLHVWMTGSGTQFNMSVNEVISNRCCQVAGLLPAVKALEDAITAEPMSGKTSS